MANILLEEQLEIGHICGRQPTGICKTKGAEEIGPMAYKNYLQSINNTRYS